MAFADPYSSWKRGLNENTNGLVRQYFPKDHDCATITEKNVAMGINKLNKPAKTMPGIQNTESGIFGHQTYCCTWNLNRRHH
jgi:IS30 family transposase